MFVCGAAAHYFYCCPESATSPAQKKRQAVFRLPYVQHEKLY
jgi:hypothetical protein